MAAQLTRDPKPLHEVNASVPPSMSALVMKLLAKDPDDRPANADAVLEELDAMTVTVGSSTPVSGGVVGMMTAPTRSLTKVFAVIGVLAVALIVTLFIIKPNAESRAQRQQQMQARRDSIRNVNDSLTKIAQAAAAPPVLSHEDSIKIADNVNRAMRQQRIRDSVGRAKVRDSIQKAEEKRARDSIFKAFGGARPAVPTKRRIVILEPQGTRNWPEAEQVGRAVADSLRSMLAKRAFTIVSTDSVRAVRATGKTAQPAEWGAMFNSELVLAIRVEERPARRGTTGPDSVMLRINAYDLTAQPRYYSRSLPQTSQWSVHEEILSSLEATLLQTIGALEEMSRAPRRTAADSIAAGATTITLPDGRVMTVPIGGVPPGAMELLRMDQRGRGGRQGRPPGDTITTVKVKKPPQF